MRSSYETNLPWNEGNASLQTEQLVTFQGEATANESHRHRSGSDY